MLGSRGGPFGHLLLLGGERKKKDKWGIENEEVTERIKSIVFFFDKKAESASCRFRPSSARNHVNNR